MVNVRKHIDVNERWEQGIDHDPRSKELLKFMSGYDLKFCDLSLDLKYGGDGDIGKPSCISWTNSSRRKMQKKVRIQTIPPEASLKFQIRRSPVTP